MGQILAFAIVTGIFVFSMLAFQMSQENARDRVIAMRAESAAARVAGAVVQTGRLVEAQGPSIEVRFLADLPLDLEGRSYRVELVPATATAPAFVRVEVPSRDITATAPLFGVEAHDEVTLCQGTVAGGRVFAVFEGNPRCISLEAAP